MTREIENKIKFSNVMIEKKHAMHKRAIRGALNPNPKHLSAFIQ